MSEKHGHETDLPRECKTCGFNYATLNEYHIRMHEKHCPYKDGNGVEQYHR